MAFTKKIKTIIRLIRPHQWIKNVFIFLPMFFSGNILNGEYWDKSLWAFFSFCAVASAIYCINDIKDIDADRNHPKKCNRPLASGAVSVQSAIVITAILLIIAFSIAFVKLNHRSKQIAPPPVVSYCQHTSLLILYTPLS